jgi:epoxyqueuosine reductase
MNAQLTKKIKDLGHALGFDKIGISPVNQPEKSKFLENWLKRNYQGTMDWIPKQKHKRMNIRILYPNAASVICVAQNYFTPYENDNNPGKVKISRYAWGEDYHRILKNKLKLFLNKMKEIDPGIEGKICVDTAPILEKLWAQQAGLGWQGKHTNIITKNYGSWIFLGEILLNKVLDYDKPIQDFCGTCSACIKACPTDAIIAPYVLDARKCISYLTIEYWDKPIPEELKNNLNKWVFGCDICQEVCPWNKYQKVTKEIRYFPKEEKINFDISEYLMMDESNFKKKFNKSPILRTGWKNFIRNVKAVWEKNTIP